MPLTLAVFSISIHSSTVWTRPPMPPESTVIGRARAAGQLQLRDPLDRSGERVRGIHHTERAVTMTARAAKCDAVALAGHGRRDDVAALAGAVHRDKHFDFVFVRTLLEE